jgi:hypothetical protein
VRARAERLAERREWLDLGHYRPDLVGPGWTSLIDSPQFFTAANGKTDPAAELEATIAAFFAPPSAAPGRAASAVRLRRPLPLAEGRAGWDPEHRRNSAVRRSTSGSRDRCRTGHADLSGGVHEQSFVDVRAHVPALRSCRAGRTNAALVVCRQLRRRS